MRPLHNNENGIISLIHKTTRKKNCHKDEICSTCVFALFPLSLVSLHLEVSQLLNLRFLRMCQGNTKNEINE